MVHAALTVLVTPILVFVFAEIVILEEHVQLLITIVPIIVTETDFVTEKQEPVLALLDS